MSLHIVSRLGGRVVEITRVVVVGGVVVGTVVGSGVVVAGSFMHSFIGSGWKNSSSWHWNTTGASRMQPTKRVTDSG